MSKVVDLSELQSHVVISTCEGVHVIPVVTLRGFSNGTLRLDSIDFGEAIMRSITASWLEQIKQRH